MLDDADQFNRRVEDFWSWYAETRGKTATPRGDGWDFLEGQRVRIWMAGQPLPMEGTFRRFEYSPLFFRFEEDAEDGTVHRLDHVSSVMPLATQEGDDSFTKEERA